MGVKITLENWGILKLFLTLFFEFHITPYVNNSAWWYPWFKSNVEKRWSRSVGRLCHPPLV